MSRDVLNEIYLKLASCRGQPGNCLPALDELAQEFRNRTSGDDASDEWLRDADYCLHEIATSAPLFVPAACRWLTADDYIELGLALLRKVSIQHLEQRIAQAYDLSGTEESQAILVACRLCARYTAPAVSLGWALSMATSLPVTEQIGKAVGFLL